MKVELLLEATDRMSGAIAAIDVKMDKLTQTERKAAAAAKDMGKAQGEAMEKIGRGATLVGAGILAGVGTQMAAFAELESAQARAQNAYSTMEGPSKFWDSINKQTIEAGNLLPGTTADYLELATAMKQAGLAEEIIAGGGFKAAAALKVMFDLNPGEAGRQTVQLGKSFGIAGKEFGGFADSIQRMREASGMGLSEIATAAPYVSRVAKPLGIGGLADAKMMLTIMGVLKQTGVEGSMVGTAVGGALEHLALMGPRLAHTRGAVMGEAKKILTENRLDLKFFNKKGDFLGLSNFVTQLDKLKVLHAEQRSIVGGAYFGQEGSALASAVGTAEFNAMAHKLVEQESLQTRLTRITGTLGSKTEALMGSARNLAAEVGSSLAPILKNLLDGGNALLGNLAELVKEHPSLTAGILGTVTAMGGFLLVGGGSLWMLGKITMGIIEFRSSMTLLLPMLQTLTGAMGPLQGGMAGFMAILGPMLPLMLLVGGAALVIATNWDVAGESFERAGTSMGHAGANLRELFAITGEESKDAAKDLSYFGSVAMIIGNTVDQAAYAFESLTGAIVVLKRELLDLIKIPAAGMGSALAQYGMSRASGKGIVASLNDAAKANNATVRDRKIESRGKSLETMKSWARDPFGFGAADLARTAQLGQVDAKGHSLEEVEARKGFRQAIQVQLRNAHLDQAEVSRGLSVSKLVDTMPLQGVDSAAFRAQLLESLEKKNPRLAAKLHSLKMDLAPVGSVSDQAVGLEASSRGIQRPAMHERLRQAQSGRAEAAPGITMDRLVDTINITAMDEASFTAQFMESVRKKAPELFRQMQRQQSLDSRGHFAPEGAH